MSGEVRRKPGFPDGISKHFVFDKVGDNYPTVYYPAFLKQLLQDRDLPYLGEAIRFTVDSVYGDFIRILASRLTGPIQSELVPEGLVPLEVWGDEEERFLSSREGGTSLRVEPTRLVEGRVFVEALGYVIDFTDEARQHAKARYLELLSREGMPPRGLEGRFR